MTSGNPVADLALGVGAGAAAAILGDKLEDWLEGDTHEMRVERAQAHALALLTHMAHNLHQIAHPAPTARDEVINLIPGMRLSLDSDRYHVCCFLLSAVTVQVTSLLGVENIALGLGWSTLDRPQGSYLQLAASATTPIPFLRRDADVPYGTEV